MKRKIIKNRKNERFLDVVWNQIFGPWLGAHVVGNRIRGFETVAAKWIGDVDRNS